VIKNIQIATLYTSVTVSESIKNEAKSLVSKATGKTVEIIEQIREDLIGGFILRIDDIQLDASVKSQLNRLSIKFRNA
jgi:F-type H+-transporting ATPase subunit delta